MKPKLAWLENKAMKYFIAAALQQLLGYVLQQCGGWLYYDE